MVLEAEEPSFPDMRNVVRHIRPGEAVVEHRDAGLLHRDEFAVNIGNADTRRGCLLRFRRKGGHRRPAMRCGGRSSRTERPVPYARRPGRLPPGGTPGPPPGAAVLR